MKICDFSGGELPIEAILAKREKLRRFNNDPEADSPCKGCHFLEEGEWPELGGGAQFNQLQIANFTLCNLRCVYCYTVLHKDWNMPKLAYPLRPIVDGLLAKGLLAADSTIEWGGGEPTIHPEFPYLAELFRQKGYRQNISTNGVAYSPEVAQGLADGTIGITTSLDSGTPETYKRVRGRDHHHEVWKNLARYVQANPEQVTAKYIVSELNNSRADVAGFLENLERAGVRHAFVTCDTNEMAAGAISGRSLAAAAELVAGCVVRGISVRLQSEYFGPENSRYIVRRLAAKSGRDFWRKLEASQVNSERWLPLLQEYATGVDRLLGRRGLGFLAMIEMPAFARPGADAPGARGDQAKRERKATRAACLMEGEASGPILCAEYCGDFAYVSLVNRTGDDAPAWSSAYLAPKGPEARDARKNSLAGELTVWSGRPFGVVNSDVAGRAVGDVRAEIGKKETLRLRLPGGGLRELVPVEGGGGSGCEFEPGWWYDERFNGVGLFLAPDGQGIFGVLHEYGEGGEPRAWLLSLDRESLDGPPRFTGEAREPGGGGKGRAVSLLLNSREELELVLANVASHMKRYDFPA